MEMISKELLSEVLDEDIDAIKIEAIFKACQWILENEQN